MAWGDCWGSSPSRNAKELAAAFYDGRARKRGRYQVKIVNAFYIEYHAFGRPIARRTLEDKIPEMVRLALVEGTAFKIEPLAFCWAGFSFEKDIARHLRGLGVPGVERAQNETRYQDGRLPELCGKPVIGDIWYTLEEAAASTLKHPAPRVTKQVREKREGFVNLTLPLPGFA